MLSESKQGKLLPEVTFELGGGTSHTSVLSETRGSSKSLRPQRAGVVQ